MTEKLKYLTEEETKMPLDLCLSQLTLGLQSCKTKGDAKELLMDAVKLGRMGKR